MLKVHSQARSESYKEKGERLPLDDQLHLMASLNREDCPFAFQLLSGCPLSPPIRFTPTLLQLAILQHSTLSTSFGVSGRTLPPPPNSLCLLPLTVQR